LIEFRLVFWREGWKSNYICDWFI